MPAQPEPAATEEADIEALLRQAEAADAAARATLTTPEEERAIIEAAETLAGSEAGVPAKSRAVVLRLESKNGWTFWRGTATSTAGTRASGRQWRWQSTTGDEYCSYFYGFEISLAETN